MQVFSLCGAVYGSLLGATVGGRFGVLGAVAGAVLGLALGAIGGAGIAGAIQLIPDQSERFSRLTPRNQSLVGMGLVLVMGVLGLGVMIALSWVDRVVRSIGQV